MQLQGQVSDVSMLMKQNIQDLNERGGKLDDLFGKTEQFENDVSLPFLIKRFLHFIHLND